MKFVLPILIVLLCVCNVTGQQITAQQRAPESGIVHLSPSEYPNLPRQIVQYLLRNKYSIAQCTEPECRKPNNVMTGHFRNRQQIDYAILASRHGQSVILVFWQSSISHIARVAEQPDSAIRVLGKADKKYIIDHYRAYGGPKPPPITHEAINDILAGKASTVLYFNDKRWLRLQGAD